MAAVLKTILDSSVSERCDVHVVVTHRAGGAGRRVVTFARALPSLLAFCLRHRSGVLHVHVTVRGSMHRKALVVLLGRTLRVPVLLHVHSGPGDLRTFHHGLGRLRRRAFRAALRGADRVVTVSEASAAVLHERYGAVAVEVMANPFPAAPDDARAADPAGPGDLRVLYLGGFANPVKGGEVLLAALPELCRRHPAATVTLAGPGTPPAFDGHDGVEWAGWLDADDKRRLLDAADVFVLPSTSEGLPVALLEAMAYGKAVVATTVGGVPDVVDHGEDGLLVPPGDTRVLAGTLADLAADPDRVRSLGRAAAARARSRTPEDLARELDRLYGELVRG
jgi:glycosyltransferase involved in cell wall biosynthesis